MRGHGVAYGDRTFADRNGIYPPLFAVCEGASPGDTLVHLPTSLKSGYETNCFAGPQVRPVCFSQVVSSHQTCPGFTGLVEGTAYCAFKCPS